MDQNIENVVNYEGRDEAYKKSKDYRQELLNANFRDTKTEANLTGFVRPQAQLTYGGPRSTHILHVELAESERETKESIDKKAKDLIPPIPLPLRPIR